MAIAASLQGCVSVTEPASRPSYVADEPDDVFYVLSAGLPFNFIIPGFDVLSVSLRRVRISGDAQETSPVYDIFVRNDARSLSRGYPSIMRVKDFLTLEVRSRLPPSHLPWWRVTFQGRRIQPNREDRWFQAATTGYIYCVGVGVGRNR